MRATRRAAEQSLWRPSRTICLHRWLWFSFLLQFPLRVPLMKWAHRSKWQLSGRRTRRSHPGLAVMCLNLQQLSPPEPGCRKTRCCCCCCSVAALLSLVLFTDTS